MADRTLLGGITSLIEGNDPCLESLGRVRAKAGGGKVGPSSGQPFRLGLGWAWLGWAGLGSAGLDLGCAVLEFVGKAKSVTLRSVRRQRE